MKEINYFEFFNQLLKNKYLILRYVLVFFFLGLAVAILSIKKYTVTTLIVPQVSNSAQNIKLGNLSSLASIAGIDLNNLTGSDAISPLLYPKVVQSLPFQLDLLKSSFYYKRANKEITLIEYFEKYKKKSISESILKYTIGLPTLMIDLLKREENIIEQYANNRGDSLFIIDKQTEKIKKKLENCIAIDVNIKMGFVTITATFDDPFFTALVVERLKQLLQQYITKYKIERATQKLKFVSERYYEKKKDFEFAQQRLAFFRDRNKNVRTEIIRAEEERLLAEYNLAFTIYNELAKQLEQAQISVKEDTPVFTVIEPSQVPYKKSSPNRIFIIFIFVLLGVLSGIAHVIYLIVDPLELKSMKN